MTKNDKIYKIVSIFGFALHSLVFVFVAVAGIFPFRENQNFYECFVGFFGDFLGVLQPYFILSILLSSCVIAFFAIKRPILSIFTSVCSFAFFLIIILPYCIEAMVVGFSSPWIGGEMASYKIAFDLMANASCIIYFDFAFIVYAGITLVLRIKKGKPLRS